ncbi:MAG: 4-hydroxy-3-methylbut-2-enyl diphosphate reductase, partial [Erysipelotrichaceae bacterium]
MEIIKVTPRGYCLGVINAINLVKDTKLKYPDQTIYLLGMIVHNQHVSDYFAKENIITLQGDNKLDLLDQIDNGVVIISAHG